jgi:hypothetical protein
MSTYEHARICAPADADHVLAAVRRAPVEVARIGTRTGLAWEDDPSLPVDSTRHGLLATSEATVSWRVEGDRVALTVRSSTPLQGLEMEAWDLTASDEQQVAFHGDPARVPSPLIATLERNRDATPLAPRLIRRAN